jgi:hypothetical protein
VLWNVMSLNIFLHWPLDIQPRSLAIAVEYAMHQQLFEQRQEIPFSCLTSLAWLSSLLQLVPCQRWLESVMCFIFSVISIEIPHNLHISQHTVLRNRNSYEFQYTFNKYIDFVQIFHVVVFKHDCLAPRIDLTYKICGSGCVKWASSWKATFTSFSLHHMKTLSFKTTCVPQLCYVGKCIRRANYVQHLKRTLEFQAVCTPAFSHYSRGTNASQMEPNLFRHAQSLVCQEKFHV